MKYLQIREKIEQDEYIGKFHEFSADVINMLVTLGLDKTQAENCFIVAAEFKNSNHTDTLNLAHKFGCIFRPSSLQSREQNLMVTIGHYYGSDRDIVERTGYPHGCKTNESIHDVTRKIIDVGLNVQVLCVKEGYVVYISHDRFVQR